MVPPTIQRLQTLSSQLEEQPERYANNVPHLITSLSSCSNEVASKGAVAALRSFFRAAIEKGDIKTFGLQKPQGAQKVCRGLDPLEIYHIWLQQQYAAYKQEMLSFCSRPTAPDVLALIWDSLMEFLGTENVGVFNHDIFESMLCSLIKSTTNSLAVVQRLVAKYAKYADVRYYTLRVIQKVAKSYIFTLQESHDFRSCEELGALLYDLLSEIPSKLEDCSVRSDKCHGSDRKLASWCGATEVDVVTGSVNYAENSQKRRKRQREAEAGRDSDKAHVRWASEKLQKKMFSEAWISFLRLPLNDEVLVDALSKIPDVVIPNMLDPLLLSDLLTAALNHGGLVGILALNGIFVLVTRHRLEYPQFYTRLYGLLKPEIFYSKHRVKFFFLADIFLASVLVPAYTAAAFVKRFARFTLTAPPAGAMMCVAFIHNIIRRHPSCIVLLHNPQPHHLHTRQRTSRGQEYDFKKPVSRSNDNTADDPSAGGTNAEPQVDRLIATDPFLPGEEDPAKSRAIESSLWEIEALRNHYCPQVASFVEILDKDLTDKTKTSEVDLQPLILQSCASLLKEHLGRKPRRPPAVEFYSQWPTRLFDSEMFESLGWMAPCPVDRDEHQQSVSSGPLSTM